VNEVNVFFDLCLVDVIQEVGLLNCFLGNVFFEIIENKKTGSTTNANRLLKGMSKDL